MTIGAGFLVVAVLAFLDAFHCNILLLERINPSFMVILPKKPSTIAINDFHPIWLQNCCVIWTKLEGTKISENFMYAAELFQVRHK